MPGLHHLFEQTWYRCRGFYCVIALVLLPLSLLFLLLGNLRRLGYRYRILRSVNLPVPVVVIGNITVGGSGKTPLVVYLVNLLRQHGYSPAIISRGYGGDYSAMPCDVSEHSDPQIVGDEALLLARRCQCPLVVAPDRVAAAETLLHSYHCDVLISDDGLQHYRLGRDIEIVMIDGERGLGNGLPLPSGPLREPPSRLRRADMIVSTGASEIASFSQRLRLQAAVNLKNSQEIKPLRDFSGIELVAVAGIGNPQRFFSSLVEAGLNATGVAFADHHRFCSDDFLAFAQQTILMTEKDAVKCAAFASSNMWYVPVESELDGDFDQRLIELFDAALTRKQ